MVHCKLIRKTTSDAGTFGDFYLGDQGPVYKAGQLPKTVGVAGESLYPAGTSLVKWVPKTPKHPDGVYKMTGDPKNPNDEIHIGNYCGDISKINPVTGQPYRSDVTGCMVLGTEQGELNGQMAVVHSGTAVIDFQNRMKVDGVPQDFMLTIVDDFEPSIA